MTVHSIAEYRGFTSHGLDVTEERLLWALHYAVDDNEIKLLREELRKIHQVMSERSVKRGRVICSPPVYHDDLIDEAYEGDAGLCDIW